MSIAKEIVKNSTNLQAMFIAAVMNGRKSEVSPWFDVYTYPSFTFSDGSLIEFAIEYEESILSAHAFDNLQEYSAA